MARHGSTRHIQNAVGRMAGSIKVGDPSRVADGRAAALDAGWDVAGWPEGWEPTPEDPSIVWGPTSPAGRYAAVTKIDQGEYGGIYPDGPAASMPSARFEWTVYDLDGAERGAGVAATVEEVIAASAEVL